MLEATTQEASEKFIQDIIDAASILDAGNVPTDDRAVYLHDAGEIIDV